MKKLLVAFLFLVVSGAQQISHASESNILILGDSLSAGYNIDLDKGWVALLRNRLREHSKNYQVINGSISGDTTDQGLLRLPALLKEHQPSIVIIELGGNDGLRGLPPKIIKKNLEKMITSSQQTGAKVLLLGIQIPPNYGKRYTQAFENNYPELAQEHGTKLVPSFLLNVGDVSEMMQSDGIHPNAKAQPLLVENVWPVLVEML